MDEPLGGVAGEVAEPLGGWVGEPVAGSVDEPLSGLVDEPLAGLNGGVASGVAALADSTVASCSRIRPVGPPSIGRPTRFGSLSASSSAGVEPRWGVGSAGGGEAGVEAGSSVGWSEAGPFGAAAGVVAVARTVVGPSGVHAAGRPARRSDAATPVRSPRLSGGAALRRASLASVQSV